MGSLADPRGPAHVFRCDEGLVVLDPRSWRTHLVPLGVLPLLDFLRSRIDSGLKDSDSLLDDLLASPDVSGEVADAGTGRVRQNLGPWVELALNLYVHES